MSLAPTTLAAVAAGGALGAVLRHAATSASARAFPDFPIGTMAVNALGSLAMGLAAWHLLRRPPEPSALAPFAMTGVLGGFTTFSAYSLDAVRLWEAGRAGAAALYALGSVALALAALVAGLALGRSLSA